MPAFVTFGRVLFAVLFIVSGASKLLDLTATAQNITDKVVLPAAFATYTAQIEGASPPRRSYWQVALPANEHLVSSSAELATEMAWSSERWLLTRHGGAVDTKEL